MLTLLSIPRISIISGSTGAIGVGITCVSSRLVLAGASLKYASLSETFSLSFTESAMSSGFRFAVLSKSIISNSLTS